jgi:hypothetical protein
MNSPTTAPLQVFVPYFREKLGLEDFREILQMTCAVDSARIHTKILRTREGTVDPYKFYYYAFLTVVPTSLTKCGRNLSKNLQNRVSTFVSHDDYFIELKPFMSVQQRVNRGYCVVESRPSSSSSSFFDSDVERDWMMKEYDDLIREIFAQGPALE